MGVRDFGAVCDASVLVNRMNFERAQQLFDGGELYLPSATYSWLNYVLPQNPSLYTSDMSLRSGTQRGE